MDENGIISIRDRGRNMKNKPSKLDEVSYIQLITTTESMVGKPSFCRFPPLQFHPIIFRLDEVAIS